MEQVEIRNPFFLRSVAPAPADLSGAHVVALRRLGKRIAIGLEHERWIVIHLMIAGRLAWHHDRPGRGGRNVLADLHFSSGTLRVTEAGTRKRASMHIVEGADLASHDPGGLEVIGSALSDFAAVLTRRNHTIKRALTDPRLLSGIGNAYSDEILHAARLSPLALTQQLDEDQIARLHQAVVDVLADWTARLRELYGERFPTRVTAFRDGMAAHGRFGKPCPDCQTAIQRIRYASSETNYCPRCQTGGRLLADRALSRLLKRDWPRTIDELEGR